MELRAAIQEILREMPDERVQEVFDFARSIAAAREKADWRAFGLSQLAKAYGDDEPEYTEQDLLPGEGE